LEDRLRATTARVVELTGTVDALQKKVASPVQVQVLDRSPNAAAQQVRPFLYGCSFNYLLGIGGKRSTAAGVVQAP